MEERVAHTQPDSHYIRYTAANALSVLTKLVAYLQYHTAKAATYVLLLGPPRKNNNNNNLRFLVPSRVHEGKALY